ncbi:poly (ADP-ribose) polymerase family-like protein, partial [Reticulomyxa filosa]
KKKKISSRGFQTPLGSLTMEQIEKGEDLLLEIFELWKNKKNPSQQDVLTNEFYSTIPHKLGRSRFDISSSKFTGYKDFEEKQETLQLMKDMLSVNKNSQKESKKSVLTNDADVMDQYTALGCNIQHLDSESKEFKDLQDEVVASVARSHAGKPPTIRNIYRVRKEEEETRFTKDMPNQRLLFHGSRACNFVGILSRGLLLPAIVVRQGLSNRTDGGWLGDGLFCFVLFPLVIINAMLVIFFTGEADTACGMFFLKKFVALGKQKTYQKITYGLRIPDEFNSAHGVPGPSSSFYDNEYVIYDEKQHKMVYLVECHR